MGREKEKPKKRAGHWAVLLDVHFWGRLSHLSHGPAPCDRHYPGRP